MARRRLQLRGEVARRGGWWKLRYWRDKKAPDGTVHRGKCPWIILGPAIGKERLTEAEARRRAWSEHLSKLDENQRIPQSEIPLAKFITDVFEKQYVDPHPVTATRVHYRNSLKFITEGCPVAKIRPRKWAIIDGNAVAPAEPERTHGLGHLKLHQVRFEQVQGLVSAILSRGYSRSQATHVKNCVHAIFSWAEQCEWWTGRNPAQGVRMPGQVQPTKGVALSIEQARQVIAALPEPARTLVLTMVLTGMNIAEARGLRWKYCNLTDDFRHLGADVIPPQTIAVREQLTQHGWGGLKRGKRKRELPIPAMLLEALEQARAGSSRIQPDDTVFQGTRGPIDAKGLMRKVVRPIAEKLGVPFGWHDLRRTFATLSDQIGMTPGARQKMMGHATARMTSLYTRSRAEQARAGLEDLAGKIKAEVVN